MSGKDRAYTKKQLHARRVRAEKDAKADRPEVDNSFRRRHDDEMRKMLNGVDHDRFEQLAG